MAKLSNINGKFAVEDTGAIRFSNQTGTTGQILKSNGNAAPTWVAASTVIGGPYLPLSGGTLTGATATASGISFTVGGTLSFGGGSSSGNLTFGPGNELRFGSSNEFGLFFSSGTSNIRVNSGILAIRADDLRLTNQANTTTNLRIDSSGNATFASDVNVQNAGTRIISLNYEDSINSIISHSGTNFGLESLNVRGDNIYFYTDYDAGTPKGNLTLTLDTSHNATFAGTVQVNGSNATVINASDPNVTVSDTDTNYRGSMRWLTSSNVLEFFTRYAGTYYTNNLVLDRGKVGIGTNSPGYKLDVVGDSGIYTNLTVGYQPVTSSTTNYENKLRVQGKNNYSNGTNWYGTYGQILLHSDTNMTGSAKRFLITNALDNNKFAIVRSSDGNTDPVVNSTASGVNSGTADFVINSAGNIGIGTTSPNAKLDIGDGDFKQLKVIGANRLCVFRFKNAQSNFNNPDIVLFSNTTATSSYPQVSVHIKMHGRGFSANYSQFTEALATVELSTALIGLRSSIINHTTLGSAVSAGAFSISGTSLRFTPNRQTNYDTFSIEVNINSISVTYDT